MAGEAASGSEQPASQAPEINGEFRFLLCDICHKEIPHPRLLPCLHNLCSQCIDQCVDQCVVCGTPKVRHAENPEHPDNVFFANLQIKLSLYRKIKSEDLVCDICKKEAGFWCDKCKEFLCLSCFRSHERYLKRENHEPRPLQDLRAESCQDFLSATRQPNTLFCSKKEHSTQILSLYCRQCNQSMCAICALLDTEHMSQRCNISEEIQCRQNELEGMNTELREKKTAYEEANGRFQELQRNMEQMTNETRALIKQEIEEMIRMLREKCKGFLAEVEAQHKHQVKEVKQKMQAMHGVVQRITTSQRLVEKLQLYASGQEVLEIHPFLRESMMELRREHPSTTEGIEVNNFLGTKNQLQNLLERVTGDREAVSAITQREPQEVGACTPAPAVHQRHLSPSPKTFFLQVKRSYAEKEMNTEGHPKKVKNEPLDGEEWSDSAFNRPGTSYGSPGGSSITGGQGDRREAPEDTSLMADDDLDAAILEDDYLINATSEEDDEDDDDDDETGASVLPLDINTTCPSVDNRGSAIVFFNLKSRPGNMLRLVALGEEPLIFRVAIFCQENTSIGMDEFLQYLSSLQDPILVGYRLWTMPLPALLDALHKTNKEERFEASIAGFLDSFPLILEKFPKNSNAAVKNLEKLYLSERLNDNNTGNFAQNLKDFCSCFEINMSQRRPLILCSNFRCFLSLQPLLQQKALSMPSVQTLALHNISLSTLHSIYQNDPEKGLMKLCRHLNSRRGIGESKINRLSKIRKYFQNLPSSSITFTDSLRNILS
ncbi:protein PML-like isoform X2 [Erythrolamprus reginae]|uniref:protein PML-like isoform X2 n=1 Tax=Erythrolamprus reginae TaxID=121349 RepID=UPI00396C9D8E